MAYPDYKDDLVADGFDANKILDRYFHSGPSFAFFRAPPEREPEFKSYLADCIFGVLRIRLHPLQLIVCGSAHLGFSPVPEKLGKPFDSDSSDIDIAIVSTELFDLWWAELQACELARINRAKVADDLFWGFINPAHVKDASETGSRWWDMFRRMETKRAKNVRGRLYRNYWSMQNYHKHAMIGGRNKLLGIRV